MMSEASMSKASMKLEDYPVGDIAYIYVSEAIAEFVHHTDRIGERAEYQRGIDYAADGSIVGYEFMNASHGLNLDGLPHHDEIAAFIERVAGLRALVGCREHPQTGERGARGYCGLSPCSQNRPMRAFVPPSTYST
jgi:uncharacterized protein YuzE